MDVVEEINLHVNLSIQYRSDQDQFGVPDYWTLPAKQGDCEDYVLLKRKLLRDKGITSFILIVRVPMLHAVLLLPDGRILDSQYPYPIDPPGINYQIVLVERHGQWFDFLKGTKVPAPKGWVNFCKRSPAECLTPKK